jgi:hypothetical protein
MIAIVCNLCWVNGGVGCCAKEMGFLRQKRTLDVEIYLNGDSALLLYLQGRLSAEFAEYYRLLRLLKVDLSQINAYRLYELDAPEG